MALMMERVESENGGGDAARGGPSSNANAKKPGDRARVPPASD